MIPQRETAWLPDLIWRNGRFESSVALVADLRGHIARFSTDPEDLRAARRLKGCALLPGLVNVHSHAFQRAIRGRTENRYSMERDTFWTWREAMYHAANRLSPDDIYTVSRMAFAEMLASGITSVGEFHYLHHNPDGTNYDDPNLLGQCVLRAAKDAGIRIQLQRTAYARAGWNREPNPLQRRFITADSHDFLHHTELLEAWIAREFEPGEATVGIAPHSVRAVPLQYLREIVAWARQRRGMKIHMHIAEQPAEIEACISEYGMRPVELLAHESLLGADFTGVHLTHLTDNEVGHLADHHTIAAICGTTERNLGDGIARADDFVKAGIPMTWGTDSNIQIDLLEDAREAEYHVRLKTLERAVLATDTGFGTLAELLFRSSTIEGAHSIGVPCGELREGMAADFFTVDLDDPSICGASPESLLSNIVFSLERTAIRDVVVAGRPVVSEGRHLDAPEVSQAFRGVMMELWGAGQ